MIKVPRHFQPQSDVLDRKPVERTNDIRVLNMNFRSNRLDRQTESDSGSGTKGGITTMDASLLEV